jgi:FtsZ-binding cell division protein ZapB
MWSAGMEQSVKVVQSLKQEIAQLKERNQQLETAAGLR